MTEQINTPELRFPEFDGEWEEKKLGAEVTFYSGLTYKPDDINFEGTFVLRSSNIKNGKLVDADNVYVDSNKINSTFVNEGDVIVVVRNGSRNLIGKHARVNTKLSNTVIGAFMTGIRCYNSKFINSLLDTNNFYREIHRNLGATINQITTGNFKKMSFYFPDDKEKEKIGEFFGKLDRQIELEEKKLELLEQQKRGYMQKIFSQGLRFKDEEGNYYKEWDTKQLKDVLEFSNKKTTNENEYPVLTSSRQGLILQSDYYKDGKTFAESNIGYFILPKNYITYRSRSDDGIFKFNLNQIIDVGIISKYYPVFKGINTNQYYLTLHLNYQLKKEYIKYATGTSQLVLSQKNLQNIQTKLPSYEEQTKIANFLSELDKLIEKQSDKVELLKDRKKGLLQKMFV